MLTEIVPLRKNIVRIVCGVDGFLVNGGVHQRGEGMKQRFWAIKMTNGNYTGYGIFNTLWLAMSRFRKLTKRRNGKRTVYFGAKVVEVELKDVKG